MLIDAYVHLVIISIEIDRFVSCVIIHAYHVLILLHVNTVQVITIIEFFHTTSITINNLTVYVYQAITTMQQIQSAYNAIQTAKLAKILQQTAYHVTKLRYHYNYKKYIKY
jgi:hypothetical protein